MKARKTNTQRLQDKMPDYQLFPRGMWHMVAAVSLMVFTIGIALITFTEILGFWVKQPTLQYVELALGVVMIFILSTPSFLLLRGRTSFYRFLVGHNLLYIAFLSGAALSLFLSGHQGMAITSAFGLGLCVISRVLYTSKGFHTGMEYYRAIWTYHRANRD